MIESIARLILVFALLAIVVTSCTVVVRIVLLIIDRWRKTSGIHNHGN